MENMSITTAIKERFIVDENGNPVNVILDIDDYRRLIDDLEELGLIRAYDAAKRSDDEFVPFEQAVREFEKSGK